jgi:2-phosphosulfolactate phosphatase
LHFHHFNLENCGSAAGLVIVIDVLRAFSTAAYAFAAGAEEIFLVSTVEDAFALKEEINQSRIMGEVDGLPVEGFDYGNSPAQFDGSNLSGIPLIQRTTSGTQGVVLSQNAETLLTTSFCNAGATAEYIESLSPTAVSFVITGKRPGGWGDEDQACADYIQSLVLKQNEDPEQFLDRVRRSIPGRYFQNSKMPEYPLRDLEYCLEISKFNFIMAVQRSGEHLRLQCSTL